MNSDITNTLTAKSDQMNAADLSGGPVTLTIERVATTGPKDQPVHIFTGAERQPWKPCLTMRRLLAAFWTPDSSTYIGRRLTLYCDHEITYGKQKPGGIRISHMSNLSGIKKISLRTSQGKTTEFTILPLEAQVVSPFISTAQAKEIWRLAQLKGATKESLLAFLEDGWKCTSSASVKAEDYEKIIEEIGKLETPLDSGTTEDEKGE